MRDSGHQSRRAKEKKTFFSLPFCRKNAQLVVNRGNAFHPTGNRGGGEQSCVVWGCPPAHPGQHVTHYVARTLWVAIGGAIRIMRAEGSIRQRVKMVLQRFLPAFGRMLWSVLLSAVAGQPPKASPHLPRRRLCQSVSSTNSVDTLPLGLWVYSTAKQHLRPAGTGTQHVQHERQLAAHRQRALKWQ